MSDDVTAHERLVTGLALYLKQIGLFDGDASSLSVDKLAGGFSHETWRLRTGTDTSAEAGLDLVAKVARPEGPLVRYDVGFEAFMCDLAGKAGLPVAQVLGVCTDDSMVGDPFILCRFVPGDVPSLSGLGAWLADQPEAFRLQCASSIVATLAALASMKPPADAAPIELESHYRAVLDEVVGGLVEVSDGLVEVPKVIVTAQRWLEARLAQLDPAAIGMVHGDFRFGNLIFRGPQVAAVLDWERASWGHALHDIGYLCLPGMRQGDLISGVMTVDELTSMWHEQTGTTLDVRACSFLRCLSMFTELCSCLRALLLYAKGRGRMTVLRIIPLVVRLENDLLNSMRRWDAGGSPL